MKFKQNTDEQLKNNRTLQEYLNSRPSKLRYWFKEIFSLQMRNYKSSCKSMSIISHENQPKSMGLTQVAEDYDPIAEDYTNNNNDDESNEETNTKNSEPLLVLKYDTIRILIVVLILSIIGFGFLIACLLKRLKCSSLFESSENINNISCFTRMFKLVKQKVSKLWIWSHHDEEAAYKRGKTRCITFSSTSNSHSLDYGIF